MPMMGKYLTTMQKSSGLSTIVGGIGINPLAVSHDDTREGGDSSASFVSCVVVPLGAGGTTSPEDRFSLILKVR